MNHYLGVPFSFLEFENFNFQRLKELFNLLLDEWLMNGTSANKINENYKTSLQLYLINVRIYWFFVNDESPINSVVKMYRCRKNPRRISALFTPVFKSAITRNREKRHLPTDYLFSLFDPAGKYLYCCSFLFLTIISCKCFEQKNFAPVTLMKAEYDFVKSL